MRRPSCVSEVHLKGSQRETPEWRIFDKRYWPGETFDEQLSFALRHEALDLLVLKRVFEAAGKKAVTRFVKQAAAGIPNRKAWFLYEMLTERTLDIPDAAAMTAVDLLDRKVYFTGAPRLSARHKVRDNLLGDQRCCPMIRRTPVLTRFAELDLGAKAQRLVGRTGKQLVARASSFLLLADTRASFAIEGERPARGRLERWGRAVVQAGRNALTIDELIRLHGILIEDTRFVRAGLRTNAVFLGERDQLGEALPEFIAARPVDLPVLVEGLLHANDRMREAQVDPVLQAAATAFGFVYIHPFEDGNGRLHRCLIHHVLAERKFSPPGMVFPVSSVLLDRIDDYRETLRKHSGPLMDWIEWRATPERNVEVLNETADLYRYFDCTEAAEFLYACVARTVEHDLPREIDYLERHDRAKTAIMERVEMPDDLAERLIHFIRQNRGRLGKKRREGEFKKLSDDEVGALEGIVSNAFADFEEGAEASDA